MLKDANIERHSVTDRKNVRLYYNTRRVEYGNMKQVQGGLKDSCRKYTRYILKPGKKRLV